MKKSLPLFLLALVLSVGLVACYPNQQSPTEVVQVPPPSTPTTPTPPEPAPIADFTARSYVTADLRHIVEFSNLSTHAVSYLWLFGDGVTSSQANPVHEYSEGGSYVVRLTVTGKDNQQATVERSVSVL